MDQATVALKALSSAQVARYHEHGYLSPVNALGADEAREVRALVESVEAENGGKWPRAIAEIASDLHRAGSHGAPPENSGRGRKPSWSRHSVPRSW